MLQCSSSLEWSPKPLASRKRRLELRGRRMLKDSRPSLTSQLERVILERYRKQQLFWSVLFIIFSEQRAITAVKTQVPCRLSFNEMRSLVDKKRQMRIQTARVASLGVWWFIEYIIYLDPENTTVRTPPSMSGIVYFKSCHFLLAKLPELPLFSLLLYTKEPIHCV